MAIGYQRQSSANITDGNIIYASFLNAEFNKLESAFDNINGHNHDGTTAGGAPVPILQTTGTLTVARGGSGATTASAARTNLGLAIGSDVQAWNDNLDNLAALTHANGRVIVSDGTNWVTESGATVRASLGLGSIATQNYSNIAVTGGSITGITDISVADGGTGASTAAGARTNLSVYSKAETDQEIVNTRSYVDNQVDDLSGVTNASAARTNLSLGSLSTQDSNNVSISGGTITGVSISGGSDLAVVDGGTGASTASAARTNLGLGTAATQADTRYVHRANNLNDVANAGAARSNLGLVIGTNIQGYDADILKSDTPDALSSGFGVTAATLTNGATVALDLTAANAFALSTTQNFTLSNPTEVTDSTKGVWFIDVSADASGPHTITLDTEYTLQDGSLTVETSSTVRLWIVQRAAGTYDVIAEVLS